MDQLEAVEDEQGLRSRDYNNIESGNRVFTHLKNARAVRTWPVITCIWSIDCGGNQLDTELELGSLDAQKPGLSNKTKIDPIDPE